MINRTCLLGGMLTALVACGSNSGDGNGSKGGASGGSLSAGGTGASTSGGTAASSGGSGNLSSTGGTAATTGGTGGLGECTSFANMPSNCGTNTTGASIKKVNTLLVVDKSGSMIEQPAGFDQNKWIALSGALRTVITNTQNLMAYGLELFPDRNVPDTCTTNCCQMPNTGFVDVGIPGGVDAITAVLDTALPGGGTPTAQALRSALAYFTTGAGSGLVGQKVVILATDGGPNCDAESFPAGCDSALCTNNIDGRPAGCDASFNCCDPAINGQPSGCLDEDAVLAAIDALAAASIPTIVLGIPGTEQYATLMGKMATHGGMPDRTTSSYYAANAANGVRGLTQTIADITVQLVQKCDLQLDQEPPDPELVSVALDCVMITKSKGDAGTGQWTLDSSTFPPTVRLLGDTCTRVETSGVQRLDVLYGCVGPTQ
jgi:hypothetical protein